ncbi:MAG: tetrathionate reductase family octaheme c-type cytochrome [Anaerolineales bacterium]
MKNSRFVWLVGLLVTLAVLIVPLVIFLPRAATPRDNPWAAIPKRATHVSHANLMDTEFATGPEVTRACLECHPDAAEQVMHTSHWTWESQPFDVAWRDEPVTIGKINQLNNFCISAQGNQKSCNACHVGYNWQEDQAYDFTAAENVDCLVCHAQSGYGKGKYGNPADTVNLLAAAKSVAAPTRQNCGSCHFNGGGGNNVKHGDLAEQLYYPDANTDVHMGGANLLCTDCHQTTEHAIKGRLVVDNMRIDPKDQVACTDCHNPQPHEDERINAHAVTVACQTCHIPYMATEDPTKTTWDWSTAGQDLGDDHFTYLKIKGSFQYENDLKPVYLWFNGNLEYRYLLGDTIDPTQPTYINKVAGSITDPQAKIFPFKLHTAKQPYDTGYNYLLAPITAGPGGYWTTFDWNSAFKLAEERIGLPYSGGYGFAETVMYWPTTHMVQPKENALQCTECHSPNGRLDWQALGYPGDPMEWGSRFSNK